MPNEDFYQIPRMSNEQQRGLLLHIISSNRTPFQIFFTGSAGCDKTFVIKFLMEIYNRYTDNDGYCHAYLTCASTGKAAAAAAISGTPVHAALKISLSRLLPFHSETAQQYRNIFKYIIIITDEVRYLVASGIEPRPSGLESDAVTTRLPTAKNIDVTDELANGAVGKLVHVETNTEGLVKTI
ncbi:ATP-dependent DNA helicase [Trichonephila clavipes]|nr:ATP-dependent DNA helicase [Trichonephila clavipes]